MKSISIAIIMLLSQLSFAQTTQQTCQQEAQIIAQVASYETDSLTDCVVKIDPASIVQYNVNQLCPLELDEVLANGVSVGLVNGHDCAMSSGDTITGVLVKKPWGTIILE